MKKINFSKLKKGKIKKKWIIGGVIVLLVIGVGIQFLTVRPKMNNTQMSSKIDTTVSTGTIQTSVSGTGTISYADTTDIVVPADLVVDEILISEGSNVAAGDLVATVDEASLALCLNEVQEAISKVDDTISSESSSSTSQSIRAGVAGRVKKIYADEDDSVVDIMKDKGALMLLSVDDLMMVTLDDVTNLAVGDEVTVGNGDTTTDGTVESVNDTGAVITFDDSVFDYEENVTVTDSEGASMGSGKAYIHQELKVVGSSGTISSLNVSVDSKVSASTKVLTLDSSAKSAEYLQAVKEREQLVDLLNTLIAIQTNGGITASVDGMLQTVNTTGESGSSTQSTSGGLMMGANDSSDSLTECVQVAENDTLNETDSAKEKDVSTGKVNGKETVVTLSDVSANKTSGESASASGFMQMSMSDTLTVLGAAEGTQTVAEAPTGLIGGAGVINGTTTDMEYADKEDATEWFMCTADITEVPAGIWYVRMKATDTMAASAAVKVEVADAVQDNTQNSEQNEGNNGAGMNTGTEADTGNSTGAGTNAGNSNGTGADAGNSTGAGTNAGNSNGTGADAGNNTESGKDNGAGKDIGNNDVAQNGSNTGTENGKEANGNKDKENSGADAEKKSIANGGSAKTSSGAGGSASGSISYSGASSSSTTTTSTSSSVETTSMFTIANGDKMMVTMYVDELDIGNMQVGLETEITLDAIEGETFTGEITNVSGNASSSGGSSQYPVEILFDKTDAMLSGMNASVEVIVEQAENVLVIPLSAIQDEGNMSYVYTNYDEASDTLSGKVQVTTGLSDETNVEITAGLAEGDTVYYEMRRSGDDASGNSGMGGFSMPGGMGGGMPGGGNMPGGMGGSHQGDFYRGQGGGR